MFIPSGLDKELLSILRRYGMGRQHALGRDYIVRHARIAYPGLRERVVRQSIHDLRRAGYLVCSAPGESGGYYLAVSLE